MDPSEYQDYMQKQAELQKENCPEGVREMKNDIDAKEKDRQYHMDAINRPIEETIVELERLRATVVSLQGENAHLRAMNRRVIEALAEQMPIQGIDHGGKYFYERFIQVENGVTHCLPPPADAEPRLPVGAGVKT